MCSTFACRDDRTPCWDEYSQSDMQCFKDLSSAVRERLTCWTIKRHFNQRHVHNVPLRMTLLTSSAVNLRPQNANSCRCVCEAKCVKCVSRTPNPGSWNPKRLQCVLPPSSRRRHGEDAKSAKAEPISLAWGGRKRKCAPCRTHVGRIQAPVLMFLGVRAQAWLKSYLECCGIICFVSHCLQSSSGPAATQRHLTHIWTANGGRLQPTFQLLHSLFSVCLSGNGLKNNKKLKAIMI